MEQVINSFSELSEHELEKAKDVLLHPRDVFATPENLEEACRTILKNGLTKLGMKHIKLAIRHLIHSTHCVTTEFVALYRDGNDNDKVVSVVTSLQRHEDHTLIGSITFGIYSFNFQLNEDLSVKADQDYSSQYQEMRECLERDSAIFEE